ncbi:MAG: hypothetical protein HRT67_02255 [Flavobacteriaceae bacterium]|nr:hypothetical protein [Flavobacteriaceae bacterium]
MSKINIKKIILGIVLGFTIIMFGLYGYAHYKKNTLDVASKNQFTKRVAYIDLKTAQLTKGFSICDSSYIVDYYNYAKGYTENSITRYIDGKNGLRKEVLSQYQNRNYTDSGYLNFRFLVNCKGEAGAYVIHENDLDLNPKQFDPELLQQLFEITTSLKQWHPNYMRGANRDSYMYISYRIENGEIIEILP